MPIKPFEKKKQKTGGRKKGTPNKSTLLFAEILDSKKGEILHKAIEMALKGNVSVMNKLLDKMLPNSIPVNLTEDVKNMNGLSGFIKSLVDGKNDSTTA